SSSSRSPPSPSAAWDPGCWPAICAVTLGYGPEELKRLFAFYDSALHSLREGLILVDGSGRLVLYNDEAAALLGLPEPDESEPIALAEAALPESVRDLLSTGRVAVDE